MVRVLPARRIQARECDHSPPAGSPRTDANSDYLNLRTLLMISSANMLQKERGRVMV
jgi:hypothetical protein